METKVLYGALGVILALTLMNTCNSCGRSSSEAKTRAAIERMDSTIALRPTAGAVDTTIRAEGLRISKRVLYGENAVVRTAVRPDDLIHKWDQELDSLTR